MAISSEYAPIRYTANGSTDTFAYTWKVFDQSHIKVTVTDTDGTSTVQTISTHYTVTGVGETSGGNVVFVTAPTDDYTVTLERDVPLTQTFDVRNQGVFYPEGHENALDRVVMQISQVNSGVDASLKLPVEETPSSAKTTLPNATDRASKAFIWDASGNPSAGTLTSVGAPLDAAYVTIGAAGDLSAERALTGTSSEIDITDGGANSAVTLSLASQVLAPIFQARLTLATGTPVTTADQTAKTTVYLTPFAGDKIALYTGSKWKLYTLTEISVAVPATTSTMYDVFVYDSSGTLTLDATAWTNDTTRATALTTQNGVYVKTGATGRRYVGSFRTTGVSGQTEDSVAKRYVWNYYNRAPRAMRVHEATNTWTYTTASFRQANNSAANQLDMVIGVDEVYVKAYALGLASHDSGGIYIVTGIGLDSATANAANTLSWGVRLEDASIVHNAPATYSGYPGIGRHYLAWLEFSGTGGTTTWNGDGFGNNTQTGIYGELMG